MKQAQFSRHILSISHWSTATKANIQSDTLIKISIEPYYLSMMIFHKLSIFILSLIYNGVGLKLQVVSTQSNPDCVPYATIFSASRTILKTLDYVTSLNPSLLPLSEIGVLGPTIDGCTVREQDRGYKLLDFLSQMIDIANRSQCFTVFIGPSLGGDCLFISDWMIHTNPDIPMLIRPYQISYLCPTVLPTREYVERCIRLNNFNAVLVDETMRYAEVSMGIQQKTISATFLSILRFYGWKEVLLLYEVSSLNAPLYWLADIITLSFGGKGHSDSSVQIIGSRRIHSDTNYYNLMLPWENYIDAILLMSGPPMAVEFLYQVQTIKRIKEGKIAIIHLDSTDSILYDVMRYWRLELSKRSNLGDAGQSLLILGALPYGNGYDYQNVNLNSDTMMSLASAVALAVKMTQHALLNNDDAIPLNTDFFAPLKNNITRLPVAPNITFTFSHLEDELTSYFDIYIFQLNTTNLYNESFDVANAPFYQLFHLVSAMLAPEFSVQELQPMKWPGGSNGPNIDICLQSSCLEGESPHFTSSIHSSHYFFKNI
ncbi:hypothetical protein ACTXT7_005860 [Hymenolepis weldensis]